MLVQRGETLSPLWNAAAGVPPEPSAATSATWGMKIIGQAVEVQSPGMRALRVSRRKRALLRIRFTVGYAAVAESNVAQVEQETR